MGGMGWNVGIRVGETAGIRISIHNVCLAQGGLYNTAETSSVSTASYSLDRQSLHCDTLGQLGEGGVK